jgi:hypothetical protein
MRTIYKWECPKCGKRYANGEEPTYCEQSIFVRTPSHPLADPDSGMLELRCGAPILPLSQPQVALDVLSTASESPARETQSWSEANMTDEVARTDGPIMATILRVIEGRKWRYARYVDRPSIELTLACQYCSIRIVATAREKEQQVIVYAMMGQRVPEARRAAVAEFITRVNDRYFIGSFNLDFEEGAICFRAGADVEGGGLTEKMVANLIDMASYAADAHHDRLMQVIYGGADPQNASTTAAA